MTTADATVEVFWTAFRALTRAEQRAIVEKLLCDRHFRENVIDAAIVEQRRREPARPVGEYLRRRARLARG